MFPVQDVQQGAALYGRPREGVWTGAFGGSILWLFAFTRSLPALPRVLLPGVCGLYHGELQQATGILEGTVCLQPAFRNVRNHAPNASMNVVLRPDPVRWERNPFPSAASPERLQTMLDARIITRQDRVHVVHAYAKRLSAHAITAHVYTRAPVIAKPVPDHTAASFEQIMEETDEEIKRLHIEIENLGRPARRVAQYERLRKQRRARGVGGPDVPLVYRNGQYVPAAPGGTPQRPTRAGPAALPELAPPSGGTISWAASPIDGASMLFAEVDSQTQHGRHPTKQKATRLLLDGLHTGELEAVLAKADTGKNNVGEPPWLKPEKPLEKLGDVEGSEGSGRSALMAWVSEWIQARIANAICEVVADPMSESVGTQPSVPTQMAPTRKVPLGPLKLDDDGHQQKAPSASPTESSRSSASPEPTPVTRAAQSLSDQLDVLLRSQMIAETSENEEDRAVREAAAKVAAAEKAQAAAEEAKQIEMVRTKAQTWVEGMWAKRAAKKLQKKKEAIARKHLQSSGSLLEESAQQDVGSLLDKAVAPVAEAQR